MAGTFSIKRRKQDTHKPHGQSSQRSVLQALGIGVGRTSPHAASKPGHIHVHDPAADALLARAAAQEWSLATGRPLPPHLRNRAPLQPPAAMSTQQRAGGYQGGQADGLPVAVVLDLYGWTSAQRRRLLHKAGAHGERPAGHIPRAQRDEAARIHRARLRRSQRAAFAATAGAYWRGQPMTADEAARFEAGLPVLRFPAADAEPQ